VPPACTLDGAVRVVGCVATVKVVLVASLVYPPLAKKRMWYVPGEVGAVNTRFALESPVAGACCVPFKNSQFRNASSWAVGT
jgi:hypothetical protein